MERKTGFAEDEFYHIYNRGTEGRNIFLDEHDRKRFITLLFAANTNKPILYRDLKNIPFPEIERDKTLVDIGAWVLMPNHFHLLIYEKEESGISRFMLKILTSYSMYFNTKYERKGRLFQGPFQSKHVDDDAYLEYLFAYIHLNPIKLIDPEWKKKGVKDLAKSGIFLEEYVHSSYLEYSGINREESLILNKDPFPDYFSKTKEFKSFVGDWLKYKSDFDF